MFELPDFPKDFNITFEKSEPQEQLVADDFLLMDKSEDCSQVASDTAGLWEIESDSSSKSMKDKDVMFCPMSPKLVDCGKRKRCSPRACRDQQQTTMGLQRQWPVNVLR